MAELFRSGLLEGVAVASAGPLRDEVRDVLGRLGAEVRAVVVDDDEQVPAEADGIHALIVDSAAFFASTTDGEDELAPLRAAGDRTWIATRAVANAAWIGPKADGGKVVFLAPRPQDGRHAEAARAALENLARTLSIEWSRYGIRTTTITPHDDTTDDTVGGIVAYLASPGGDYFSGARLDLRR